ncbi:anaphase-promoting complex subunit cdc27 [Massospora cicadina]|nr:anaphase-promoting complex subunit cdc27 [Massospora cicadina]
MSGNDNFGEFSLNEPSLELSTSQGSLEPPRPILDESQPSYIPEDDGVDDDSLDGFRDATIYDLLTCHQTLPQLIVPPEGLEDSEKVENQLTNMIWYWLDQEMYDSALFAAERLVYQDKKNPHAWFLLALSYYRATKFKAASVLLKHLPHRLVGLDSLFLLGRLSLKLKEYDKAEEAFRSLLKKPLPLAHSSINSAASRRCYTPDRCSVLILLADTLKVTFRNEEAVELYNEALAINPYAWKPFEDVCLIVSNALPPELVTSRFASRKRPPQDAQLSPLQRAGFKSFKANEREQPAGELLASPILCSPSQDRHKDAPLQDQNYVLPCYSTRSISPDENKPPASTLGSPDRGYVLPPTDESNLKQQTNLDKILSYSSLPQTLRFKGLDALFMPLALCQTWLAKVDPDAALKALSALPACQSSSPWKSEFADAKRVFLEAVAEAPYSTSSLDVYSTVLWHLKDVAHLNLLVSELHELDPTCYESLLAVGNAYSLQGWLRRAVKTFEEASKLYPFRPHAYTLAGHECRAMKLDTLATEKFLAALRICPRNHSAWYGLGSLALAEGRRSRALYCFREAQKISPNNIALVQHYAFTLIRDGELRLALDVYDKALEYAPTNDALKFRRAQLLIAQRSFGEALEMLRGLQLRHRRDGYFHFTLGKLLLLMGNHADGYTRLRWAVDLLPSVSESVDNLITSYEQGKLEALSSESLHSIVYELEGPSAA